MMKIMPPRLYMFSGACSNPKEFIKNLLKYPTGPNRNVHAIAPIKGGIKYGIDRSLFQYFTPGTLVRTTTHDKNTPMMVENMVAGITTINEFFILFRIPGSENTVT